MISHTNNETLDGYNLVLFKLCTPKLLYKNQNLVFSFFLFVNRSTPEESYELLLYKQQQQQQTLYAVKQLKDLMTGEGARDSVKNCKCRRLIRAKSLNKRCFTYQLAYSTV